MAGALAAARGRRTLLLEKNNMPGAKILIAGGGRCNLTHDCDAWGIIETLGTPGKFLHSALAALGPQEVVEFFRQQGVPTYVEPDTGKVFPQSNRSSDVVAALLRRIKATGCELATAEPLVELDDDGDSTQSGFRLTTTKRTLTAENVLLATGGKSYPDCGTTGDGYRFAEKFGHTIIPPRPALVPVSTNVEAIRDLQGITLPDVLVRVIERGAGCQPATEIGQVGNLPH
jgi:predicted Rossmann fold flavoprotein